MRKNSNILILLNLVIVLAYFLYAIRQKEHILSQGKIVKMELAPVDPRSLMQGDYMQLNYKETNKILRSMKSYDSLSPRGYAVVKLNDHQIGQIVRMQKGQLPLASDETLVEYNKNLFSISIGAESFFFQEGQSEKYSHAKYGIIRVDEHGNTVLVGVE